MIEARPHTRFAFDPCLTREAAQRVLRQALTDNRIESAALDARILLCAALGIDHAALVRDPDALLGVAAARLEAFALRRVSHEPVSRIVGHREFFGETFLIDPAVLDPRPDTECLVETVLDRFRARKDDPLKILDLGVGSGAILAALLRALGHATGIGIDLSPAACMTARANLFALGLSDRASIVTGEWTKPLKGVFDIIVSNPPYIESDAIDGLDAEVRCHDPRLALDGGVDGLAAYRAIACELSDHLAPGGLIVLEFGDGQRAAVETILQSAGLQVIGCKRDLADRERVVLATAG
jgi:release factor glutamine methyltransferase